ncbi:hypothetical protein JCM16816_23120 [Thermoanaerobacter brockii subsp. lactiethylicus]|jgi:hypothetical protein|nr:MAG: hypothetical protein XD37_0590 [Thermoanaerobacter thermocopriae]
MDESKYTYNKDSDQWFCMEGNHTVKKEHVKRKKGGKFKEDSQPGILLF